MLDIVRAARKLDPTLGKKRRDRRPLAGRPRRAVGRLAGARSGRRSSSSRGTRRVRPRQPPRRAGRAARARSPPRAALSGLAAMIVRGVDVAHPVAGHRSLLSDRGRGALPAGRRRLPRRPRRRPTPSAASRRPSCSGPARTSRRSIAALNANDPEDAEDPLAGADRAGHGRHDGLPDVHRPARRRSSRPTA